MIFRILGITIQDNCESDQTWQKVRLQALGIHYKVARCTDWRSIAVYFRMRELNSKILPFLTYKLAAVPLTTTRIYQIQKLQRTIVVGTLRIHLPGDISLLKNRNSGMRLQALGSSSFHGIRRSQRCSFSTIRTSEGACGHSIGLALLRFQLTLELSATGRGQGACSECTEGTSLSAGVLR